MKNFLFSNKKNIKLVAGILIIFLILFVNLAYYLHLNLFLVLIFLSFLVYIMTIVIVNFKFNFVESFGLLLFPAILFFFAFYFTINIFIPLFNLYGGVGFVVLSNFIYVIISLILYASLLNISIIRASYIDNVPLAQFSYTVNYMLSVVCSYLVFSVLFMKLSSLLVIISVCLFVFILFMQILYFLGEYKLYDIILYSFFAVILIANMSALLIFYPIVGFLSALILSICVYIYEGILIHIKRGELSKYNIFEYSLLIILIFACLLFFPRWGIVGGV